MEDQLMYLLSLHKSPFAQDPQFAFMFYNIIQKKKLSRDCLFRVKKHRYLGLMEKLQATDPEVLKRLEAKLDHNPSYQSTDEDERQILQILSLLQTINNRLPGTNGYKKRLRNEIRAPIHHLGVPGLFITINPSDVNNPLVRLLYGDDINLESVTRGEDLSKFERQKLAAKNPHITATYIRKTSFRI
jgi:hypothetical protein